MDVRVFWGDEVGRKGAPGSSPSRVDEEAVVVSVVVVVTGGLDGETVVVTVTMMVDRVGSEMIRVEVVVRVVGVDGGGDDDGDDEEERTPIYLSLLFV